MRHVTLFRAMHKYMTTLSLAPACFEVCDSNIFGTVPKDSAASTCMTSRFEVERIGAGGALRIEVKRICGAAVCVIDRKVKVRRCCCCSGVHAECVIDNACPLDGASIDSVCLWNGSSLMRAISNISGVCVCRMGNYTLMKKIIRWIQPDGIVYMSEQK